MASESAMAIIQASAFYDQDFGGPSLLHTSSNSSPEGHIYGHSEQSRPVYRGPESPEKAGKNFTVSNSSTVSSPSSTNSNGGLGFHHTTAAAYSVAEEGNSVITFKPEFGNYNTHVNAGGGGSLLSFDQTKRGMIHKNLNPKLIGEEDHDYPMWEGDHHHHLHYQNQLNAKPAAANNHGPPETSSAVTEYDSSSGGVQWAWLNDDGVTNNGGEEIEAANNKRPSTGENLQAAKKQCVAASKKGKPKPPAESKDPQSVAAKNRRERISERLKILQELVPNGSKVDLVTMLEKAISYVKFLQLQVKVLATDEFWPAQGGKAPDLCQVREAIDAILASQRDRNSTSKS